MDDEFIMRLGTAPAIVTRARQPAKRLLTITAGRRKFCVSHLDVTNTESQFRTVEMADKHAPDLAQRKDSRQKPDFP
jgi:hypothetical protein